MREQNERPAAGDRTRRSPFEGFVEGAYQVVSRPPFFFVCLAVGLEERH